MNPEWFGDSYDIVKRFLSAELQRVGVRVYADPMLTGEWPDGAAAFLAFIGATHADEARGSDYNTALFIDPDTGVRERASARHCTITYMVRQAEKFSLVFAFDQSFSRNAPAQIQMEYKLDQLRELGVHGFYYDSHARFLFTARQRRHLLKARDSLIAAGLPERRLVELRRAQQVAAGDAAKPRA
jgi:hypothetical protein